MIKDDQVIQALKQVYDPEIPVDIYELGFIYNIAITPTCGIEILMTLTSPTCPAADYILSQVESQLGAIEGVSDVVVSLTFDPPYSPDMMSDIANVELGFVWLDYGHIGCSCLFDSNFLRVASFLEVKRRYG